MAEFIKQLKLGENLYYDFDASKFAGKTEQEWKDLISSGLKLVLVDELPTASDLTMGKIYLVPHEHGEKDIKDEFITIDKGEGVSPRYIWEKIGNTDIDLSGYALKGEYTTGAPSSNETSSAGGQTITSSEAGAETAVGTATISYQKADNVTGSAGAGESSNTGEAGDFTISGSDFGFSGTKATLSATISGTEVADHNYTPEGTIDAPVISINSTPKTVAVEGIKSVTSEFVGTTATITVSGNVEGTAVADHDYTPEGTIGGNQEIAAHTHAVNAAKSTTTISAISAFNGGTLTAASFTANGDDEFTPASISTGFFSQGTTASYTQGSKATLSYKTGATANALASATVNDGVLSFVSNAYSTEASVIENFTANGDDTFVTNGLPSIDSTKFNGGTFTQGSKATYTNGVFTPATITYANSDITYVTGATLGEAGYAKILGSNFTFTGTTATLEHSVTNGSFTKTINYQPAGTISNTYGAASTISINNVSGATASAPTFTGASVTLSHNVTEGSFSVEYTPAGTLTGTKSVAAHSHSYTKPTAHTHSIGFTATEVTGTASVAVSGHTHSVTVAAHTHDLSNHTHNVEIDEPNE